MPRGIFIHRDNCQCFVCKAKQGKFKGKNSPRWGGMSKKIRDESENIKILYFDHQLSHKEIAKIYGCSRSLIHKLSKEIGISGVVTSSRCKGENNYNWKGGRCLALGYITIPNYIGRFKNNRQFEHRKIAEMALGREMKRHEVVHHINGDKSDNRNCNLLVCSSSYHRWLEEKMNGLYKIEHFGHI